MRYGSFNRSINAIAVPAGIVGVVLSLGWTRDPFAQTLPGVGLTRIDRHLQGLLGSVVDREPAVAKREAEALLETLAGLGGN